MLGDVSVTAYVRAVGKLEIRLTLCSAQTNGGLGTSQGAVLAMIRRLTVAAAVPIIAGLGVALSAPANAAGGQQSNHQALLRAAARIAPSAAVGPSGACNLVVPTTGRVGKFITEIPVQATGDCASQPGLNAIWYVGSNLTTSVDGVIFDGSAKGTWGLFSDTQLGTRTWKGWAAVDGATNSYTQNAPTTTVKVVSYAGLHTTRAGGRTTINTRVIRYATSLDETIPYAGETGLIQYRPVGGSTWLGLKNATANSKGLYSYTYTTSQKREYRVVFNEATYVWSSVSPTSTR